MRYAIPILLSLSTLADAAVVVDRVAIVVGKRVVKASDVEGDLRVSQFLNSQALDLSPAVRRKAAERLIDQELIRQELLNRDYTQPSDSDVSAYLEQLRRDRFSGSETQFRAALARYRLSEEQLRRHLRWQLTVLHFIDRRFRPGVLVTDEDVSAYYQQHRAELQKAFPKDSSLEAVEPSIRETLTGERVNQFFDQWVEQKRKATRIEYRDAAFAGGAPPAGALK
jgi:peptidyl-prolyl cis-trans isomerase SurA